VDDFGDTVNSRYGPSILDLHRSYGVEVIHADVLNDDLRMPCAGVDAITSFHSIEHWHSSPKRLFRAAARALAPGGVFVLGSPNCVNLRKRLAVPLGRSKWSSMGEWYESEVFRGHVREPDVEDLRYIAADMGLSDVQLYGRNWLGYINPRRAYRALAALVDRPLRASPSLCSDIYVVGTKPADWVPPDEPRANGSR